MGADREEQEDADGGGHGASCTEHRRHLSRASVHKNTLYRAVGMTWKSFSVFPFALLQKGIWDIWKKALGPGSWVSSMLLGIGGISWCVWVQQNFCERSNEALS